MTSSEFPLHEHAGDEQQLVARIRAGDAAAFDALFVLYYAELLAFARSYVHVRDVAEDVLQDVFFRIWERRDEWVIRGSVAQYLYGAVRNRALDVVKHDMVVARWETRQGIVAERVAENEGVGWVAGNELAALVSRVVASLPPRCQEVFRLSRYSRLPQREIAEMLGITVNTVNVQLGRALRAIHEALGEGDGAGPVGPVG